MTTRREQIEVASKEFYGKYWDDHIVGIGYEGFLLGAEWADANPITKYGSGELGMMYLRLETKLAMAIEALNWESEHSIDPATRVNCEKALEGKE